MAERGTREHWEENVEAGRKGLWVHSDHRDYSAYALGQSQRAPGFGSRSTSSFSNPPSTPTSNFSISSFSSPSISSSSFGGSSSSYSSGTSSASGVIGGLVVLGLIIVGLGAILKDSPNSQTSSSDFRVGQSVTVGTINLNLRSGPGTNFGVVAIMPEGTRARVVGQTNDGWIELNVPAQDGGIFHGFANSSYMTSGGDDAVSDESGQTSSSTSSGSDDGFGVGQYVEVDTINLNLRLGPGTNFDVVAVMPQGARARVIGTVANGWLELDNIRGNGNQFFHGFANSKYLASIR